MKWIKIFKRLNIITRKTINCFTFICINSIDQKKKSFIKDHFSTHKNRIYLKFFLCITLSEKKYLLKKTVSFRNLFLRKLPKKYIPTKKEHHSFQSIFNSILQSQFFLLEIKCFSTTINFELPSLIQDGLQFEILEKKLLFQGILLQMNKNQ